MAPQHRLRVGKGECEFSKAVHYNNSKHVFDSTRTRSTDILACITLTLRPHSGAFRRKIMLSATVML
jgi:hypothetical protein